jgi:DNA-binding NarL/FixJ family response regulator
MSRRIHVGIADEHELYRRGLEACLVEDSSLTVHRLDEDGQPGPLDVAVVSAHAAERLELDCPLVVCATASPRNRNPRAASVLNRSTATPAQLRAAVRAAAAGLRVEVSTNVPDAVDARSRRLLELLADGHTTREMAERMSYSERTIKKQISELERRFRARSRAQMVAIAVRDGVI